MKTTPLLPVFLLLILISGTVHAQGDEPFIPNPPPEGTYILDELDWLTSEQEVRINSTIQHLDNDSLAEIAVVTLDDCGTDKQAFRKSLFETWGIGHTNDNDGLLILVCWYGGDESRRSVEQLFGSGLNNALSSKLTDQYVQNYFVPAFQKEYPGEGIMDMVSAYDQLLRGSINQPHQMSQKPDYWIIGFLAFAVGVLLFAIKRFQNLPDEKPQDKKGSHRKTETRTTKRKKKEESGWWFGSGGGDGGGFDGGSSDGGGGSSSNF